MVPQLRHRSPDDFATMSADDMSALLACARELQSSTPGGTTLRALRGKNLGLVCDAAGDADAALFERAATALGAQVAQLRTSLSDQSSLQEVGHTARVLGRLYDAVECIDLPARLVPQIRAEAGVPVFDGLASPRHPTSMLASLLDQAMALDDRRCLVIQAVLLRALA